MKLRRTLLWVNGYDKEKLLKGINETDADVIVLELEDMIEEKYKIEARNGAASALKTIDFKGKERAVRINGLNTPWGREDLEAIMPAVPDLIRIPCCETVRDVIEIDAILTQYELTHSIPKNTMELMLMIESPKGLLNAYDMACSAERVTGLGFGAGDYCGFMNIDRDLTADSTQLLYAKQKLVTAAKAAGVDAFDTTIITPKGEEASMNEFLRKDTENIKKMGFSGRSVSMLPHINIINSVYAPSQEAVDRAKRQLDGYKKGVAEGLNEIWVDGVIMLRPMIKAAEKVVELAETIEARKARLTI